MQDDSNNPLIGIGGWSTGAVARRGALTAQQAVRQEYVRNKSVLRVQIEIAPPMAPPPSTETSDEAVRNHA